MFIPYAQAPPPVAAPTPALYINGSAVQMTTEIKILGVTIISTLNWSVHADQVRKKISRMSGVLQWFGCTQDSHSRLRIFNAFILPHVLYCLPVWGNLPTSHCDLFNRSLLRCAKMIQRNVRTELNRDTYNVTGILPFEQFVFLRNVLAVFSILRSNNCEQYLHTSCLSAVSQYSTKQHDGCRIITLKFARQCDKFNFAAASVNDWNELPSNITAMTDFNLFKKIYFHLSLTN